MGINELTRIEQNRAGYAFDCVKNKDQSIAEDYKSCIKRLPMLIKNNGLAPALAFVFSKRKSEKNNHDNSEKDANKKTNAYFYLYQDIGNWLKKEQCSHLINNITDNDINDNELIEKIIKVPVENYRALTLEIIALLNWLKRFADGLIEDKTEGNNGA